MANVGLTMRGPGADRRAQLQIDCRAVLFDLDGVLVDSTTSVERHWTTFAARHGVDQQAIRRVMHGRRSQDTIRDVAPNLDPEAEGLRIDQDQAADGEGLRPIAGAGQLLAALSGAHWAVVTSGPRFLAEARLRMVGLPPAEVLISGNDVQHGKPDPSGYLKAAARLGVNPADCVVIEDARAGVRAGITAGMPVIGVLTNHRPSELPGVRAAVPDLRAIEVFRADRERIGLLVSPVARISEV
jgi:sugar-phosphatase